MDRRRWWGAAVVAVVLLAAIIVPNLTSHRVAGQASAGVLPEPPAVGDCLTSMTDPWVHFDDPAPRTDDVFDYPTATVGSCDWPIVAEVVTVALAADPARRVSATDYLSDISPCAIDAIAYTGSIPPVVQLAPDKPGILWTPRLDFQYTTIGPNLAQRAAGQQWSACVIGSSDSAPFTGRLRDVLTDGTLPGTFGSCLSSADPNYYVAVPCDRPHAAEVLGTTNLGPTTATAADLQQACQVFAGRAMRTADPRRGGEIGLQLNAFGEAGSVVVAPDDGPQASTYLECVAVAPVGKSFTHSLIGLGQGAVPYG